MKFTEKGRISLTTTKDLVVSEREDGNLTLAQQITVDENGQQLGIFLKNTIVLSKENVINLKKILNKVK